MNSFLRSRLCRCCVCLILVLVLLISWSPIRAQASIIGGAALLFGDDAIAIILAVLAGLGVFAVANSETSDLETRAIAQSALDAMEDAGSFVQDGALSVYTSLTEAWSYAVPTGLVQWLHDWMFDTGVVASVGAHYSANTPCVNIWGTELIPLCDYNYYRVRWTDTATSKQYVLGLVLFINGNTYRLANGTVREAKAHKYGNKTYYVSANNTLYRDEFVGFHDLGHLDCSAFSAPADAAIDYLFEHYISVNAPAVTTPYDLTLGTVAPSGTDIETEYGEHIVIIAPNGVPDTGGDGGDEEQPKIPVLPVPYLPPSEIPNVPQKDIWNGNKVEIENPDTGDTPDPTTGTDTDDPDSGSNNPTTPNPDPGTNPGTGVPSDIGKYQIDLKDFFPFCIPFDLYRFFEILCAEPEAPVFHWEFNVFGELHSLDVDLSPWNPHAQLFRDAQVGLFIMGLLWITRKFIKW